MTRKPPILIGCLLLICTLSANAQAPVADFSSNTVAGCGPLAVAFTDASSGNPTSWTWDFGNGQISSLQNPNVTYGNPGTYTVTLIVKNSSGANSIRKTDYITVYPFPTANFKANLTLACAPATVQFTDLSTPGAGTIVTWSWNFEDGSPPSNQQNPTKTYTQTGYYSLALTVTNSQGCSNSAGATRYIRLVQGVQADFGWSQTSASCSPPFNLNFNNQTSGPGNLSYNWDLGNGNTSTLTNPSATYPANTNYTVNLTAVSDLGCSLSVQKTVSFPAANPAITAPDSACLNTAVSFQNGSIPKPLTSAWTFGDGDSSRATNPVNTYTTLGTYPVKLVNTYAACADSIIKNVKIVISPTADFTATKTATCKEPFVVSFQDQSTPGANTWLWDFGDGTPTSALQNPSHTYTTAGSFDVTLTVTNAVGCAGTVTKTKFIQITPPSAILTLGQAGGCTGPGGFTYNPAVTITAVDGIAAYFWTAAGATPNTSTSPTPSFNYTTAGNYDIILKVTTNDGCSSTTTFSDAVNIGNPVAPAFNIIPAATDICPHTPVTFTSTSSPTDHWVWDFGDGSQTQDSVIVHHAYADTGFQTITLTVVNNGCSQTDSFPKFIHVNPPIAGFMDTIDCTARHKVNFTNSSIVDPGKPLTYHWDFGDPLHSVSSAKDTSFIYPTLDSFRVTLTVTNGSCIDTFTKTIHLDSLIASFTYPKTRVCKNEIFQLSAVITNPSVTQSYLWQVGAGNPFTAADEFFSDQLPDTGTYSLTMIIKDVNGCLDTSATSFIKVTGPTAKFIPAGPGGCKNSPVLFTDQSIPYNAGFPLTSWSWDFGDGTPVKSFTAPPFTHAYADSGFYEVRLTVQDDSGCTATYQSTDTVQITSPKAGFFSIDTSFYCPNEPLPFIDTSTGYKLTRLWSFGDGDTSTQTNPAHSFPTSGQKYSITLKVTDQVGCSDSVTRINYITIQKPIAAFTLADSTTICPPLQTSFTPQGQFYDSLYWDFGDGSTSTLPITTHFYNSYDTFMARLILRGRGGCLDSASRRVFVLNPSTTTTFSYSPLQACDSVLTNFTVIPPGYTRRTLLFSDGKADSSANTNFPHLYKGPSTYLPQLVLTDSTGCIIGINGPYPVIVLGAVPFFIMDKHAFCDSGTVNFTDFTITNDSIVSETWAFGDGNTTTTPNPSHDYSVPGNFLANLHVDTKSNCAENFTDTVMIFQTPHPVFTVANAFCVGSPIQFQGNLLIPDIDSVIWAWNFGDGQVAQQQDPLVTYPHPGSYTVSLKTSVSFGCSDTTSQSIVIHGLPLIKGPAQITTPLGFPVTIPFTYSNDVVGYSWTPPANLSCTDCANPIATPIFKTEYTVTATDSNNCVAMDSILVSTICNGKNYYLPNTFSPNGDGVNDAFYPRGVSIYNIQSMKIFNRWGQLVFERRDFPANAAALGWDGTYNHQPAPVDVYVYIVDVVCDNAQIITLNGNVSLIR